MVCVKLKDEFHEGIPYKNSQFTDSKEQGQRQLLLWNIKDWSGT